MMGRKALIAVLCWIALNGTSAKAVQTSNSVGLIDNVSAESAPPLYRNVPVSVYSYASATPYAAYSFHVPQFLAPNFNHVPLNQERILAQSTNNYLKDSYGQRFVDAPQPYAYKAALPQQFVPLQKLPAHLSQPLVAAAPNAQYGQATHFFGAPFRLANLQAFSPQNGNQFSALQPVVYAQNVRTLASPATKQANGQPVAQQQSTRNNNVYANAQYSQFWNQPKAQTKQEEPKISASDHKENQHIVQSLPLVHAPKQTTITSFNNGKKTVVNLITKPPVPLLDLTLLEPLTFDNPLVPQVQHFLPRIHSVTYKKLHELDQQDHPKVITIKKKTTKKTKKQKKPKIIKDEVEVNHTPSVNNDHETELSYEVNRSPTYKETVSEKKISYNKETTSKPVVISYEKKTEMKPVSYSYGKHVQKEPVHYNYVHNSNEPAKQAYLDDNKEKTKHLIYHFTPEEQSEEQNEQNYNSAPHLESVEIIEENPNESDSEEVSPQQDLQHHEPQNEHHQHQQHEHRPQQHQQHEPHKSQPHNSLHQKHNEPQPHYHQQHQPYEPRQHQQYEPRQYQQYEPHQHQHHHHHHHQQQQQQQQQHQKYEPQQHQQHQNHEVQHQHHQQHQNHGHHQQQTQHTPQQQIHDNAQHELAEEAYNEPNQNFREEPEPEDREVAYYQNSKENIETEPREEVYYPNSKNAHVESREESPEPVVYKSSPQQEKKQYEAIVPEYEEDIIILPAQKPHAPIHAEENSNRGSNNKHKSHPESHSEQVHYDYPTSYYSSPPAPQAKSNRIIIKDDPPQQKEEVYKPNDELIEAMVKKQEESEEDFEQAYKDAAYGFQRYVAPVRNTDREKEIYNPANYGVPRYHNDFDEEKSPLRQYEPEGDEYPAEMRSNYKDSRDKTNEDYYTDYSVSRPQSLIERKKQKEEYYDNYNEHKPQNYYAKDDSDKQQSAKYIAGPAYSYPAPPQQKFAKFTSRITPLDEYNYVKEAPTDSSAFGTGTYASKMQFLEPHYQYGFEPIRVSRLLDRELAAMASDHSPETVKKMYKENFYIEQSSTSKGEKLTS
ncbi:probable serine/threonine-protein kinase yakA [Maniola hyperantus]|uniref:probable serine/threonine-protein kinase yakA n=1 Tax=Aphantopus hyperantus TaxID=2795564 RepID=UPI0021273307